MRVGQGLDMYSDVGLGAASLTQYLESPRGRDDPPGSSYALERGAFVIIPTYDFDSLYPFNIIRLNRPQTVERTNPRSHVWGNTLTVMDDYSGLRFALSDEAARFYYGDLLQDNKRPGSFKIPDDEIKIII